MITWNPEEITPGLKIPVHEGCARCVYSLETSWFAYVQHGCLVDSPNYQKLMMRDGGWRGAMKAFVTNYREEGKKDLLLRREIDHLVVIRVSRSGKSIITRAVFVLEEEVLPSGT